MSTTRWGYNQAPFGKPAEPCKLCRTVARLTIGVCAFVGCLFMMSVIVR